MDGRPLESNHVIFVLVRRQRLKFCAKLKIFHKAFFWSSLYFSTKYQPKKTFLTSPWCQLNNLEWRDVGTRMGLCLKSFEWLNEKLTHRRQKNRFLVFQSLDKRERDGWGRSKSRVGRDRREHRAWPWAGDHGGDDDADDGEDDDEDDKNTRLHHRQMMRAPGLILNSSHFYLMISQLNLSYQMWQHTYLQNTWEGNMLYFFCNATGGV